MTTTTPRQLHDRLQQRQNAWHLFSNDWLILGIGIALCGSLWYAAE